jgi:hypothetical protein
MVVFAPMPMDCDGGEPGTLSKRAQRVRHILATAVDERETPCVSTLFFPLIHRAHLPKGSISSFRWRETCSDMLVNEALQVVLKLFVELPFHLAASKQRQDTQTKCSGPAHAPSPRHSGFTTSEIAVDKRSHWAVSAFKALRPAAVSL